MSSTDYGAFSSERAAKFDKALRVLSLIPQVISALCSPKPYRATVTLNMNERPFCGMRFDAYGTAGSEYFQLNRL